MFNAQRKRVIREAVWKPWRPGRLKEHENVLPSLQSIQHEKLSTREEDIQFLEFWNYEDVGTPVPLLESPSTPAHVQARPVRHHPTENRQLRRHHPRRPRRRLAGPERPLLPEEPQPRCSRRHQDPRLRAAGE